MEFSFVVPGQVIFGPGCISCLPDKVRELKAGGILIITSHGMPQRDFYKEALHNLESSGVSCQVYNQAPEPTMLDVKECLRFAVKHNCGLVIGLGGGSVMDVAKRVAMDLTIPKIMIPTTAGSGSEVTHESVLKVDGKKKAFVDVRLTPNIAIVDPQLVANQPPRLAVSSGIDALAHAIESYSSKGANPLTKALSWEAYTLIKNSLAKAIHGDIQARNNLSLGSLIAGMAFGNSGTTLAHALSYPLSNQGIPHGEAIAIVLPYALVFNGFDETITTEISTLIRETGLPTKFRGDIESMAKAVMDDTKHLLANPRLVSLSDITEIYERIGDES